MSDENTTPENPGATENAAPNAPVTTETAAPLVPPETLEQAKARILALPLTYPPFRRHEAAFRGSVVVEILRGKLSKSDTGADQILVEGVVKRTQKIPGPVAQYPASNPQGWDMFGFAETEVEAPLVDEQGHPVLDEEGKPRFARKFPELGHVDVTGHRFVYADELIKNEEGAMGKDGKPLGPFFWRTERLINNLRFLGWRPGRCKAPRNGSLTDFVPDEGKDWVPAADLGMSGDFGALFDFEQVQENSKFAPRIMLVGFRLLDTRVTRDEAQSLDSKFGALLAATQDGTKYDGRKVAQRAATAVPQNAPAGPVKGGKGSQAAVSADAARVKEERVSGTPPEFCGKPCGRDHQPCKEKPGHDTGAKPTACVPIPF